MVENAALCADDGAEEPINVLTKILLNKLDKNKEGRKILCDPTFTQVGIAHEVFDQENMVIMIFASRQVEPIQKSKNDFLKNIQYRETKEIKNPKFQANVFHRIKGDIFGGEGGKITYERQMFSHGESRPKLEGAANPQKLRGNKSELKMTTKTTNTREKAPVTSTGKKEIIQETKVGRRNEGTSLKTETKTESKTTNRGLRGNQNESKVSTKTTTKTTTERPGKEEKKTTGKTTTTTTTKTTTKTVTKVEETKGGETGGGSVRNKYAKRRFGK